MPTESLLPFCPWRRLTTSGLFVCLAACQPEPPPFVPRDASYDADLDAPPMIVRDRDTPDPIDAFAVPDADGGAPDFDAGALLPILIDGELREVEWEGTTRATSTAVGSGIFAGCSLRALRVTSDAVNVYFAVEATLCAGSIVLFIDTDVLGVSLALTGLGDLSGEVDAALSRVLTLVDPGFSPRYAWGTTNMPSPLGPASDRLGFRELAQDGPHRHFTTDLSRCSDMACETVVSRSALGFPTTLRLTARIGTSADGSTLALPPDFGAGESITTFVTVSLAP